jgi:hypothetical protein
MLFSVHGRQRPNKALFKLLVLFCQLLYNQLYSNYACSKFQVNRTSGSKATYLYILRKSQKKTLFCVTCINFKFTMYVKNLYYDSLSKSLVHTWLIINPTANPEEISAKYPWIPKMCVFQEIHKMCNKIRFWTIQDTCPS